MARCIASYAGDDGCEGHGFPDDCGSWDAVDRDGVLMGRRSHGSKVVVQEEAHHKEDRFEMPFGTVDAVDVAAAAGKPWNCSQVLWGTGTDCWCCQEVGCPPCSRS